MELRGTQLMALVSLTLASTGLHAEEAPANSSKTGAPKLPALGILTRYRALVAAGHSKQAVAELTAALKLQPRNLDLLVARSFAYGANKNFLGADADRQSFYRIGGDAKTKLLETSLQDFKALASREPKNAHAYLNIGDINIYQGKLDAAIKNIDRAIQLDPKLPFAYQSKGVALGNKGDSVGALANFKKVIVLSPGAAAGAYQGIGYNYASQGKFTEAIANLSQAVKLDPKNTNSLRLRGEVYGALAKYPQAFADFDRAIALEPDNAASYMSRGLSFMNSGQGYKSLAEFDVALALEPKNANAHLYRGQAFTQNKNYKEAVADFTSSLSVEPKNAMALYGRGTAYFYLKQNDKALADYNKAVALAPKDSGTFYQRGSFYLAQGKNDLAIADLTKAVSLNPKDLNSLLALASAYSQAGQQAKVIATSKKVLQLDKTNVEATNRIVLAEATMAIAAAPKDAARYAKRAELQASLGNKDAVLADYTAAVKLAPSNARYLNARAVAYANKGMEAEMNADLNRAIAADPSYAKAYENRSQTSRDNDQNLIDTTRAIELDPKSFRSYLKRAEIRAERKQYDDAIADYEAALKLDPKQADIYISLAAIYETREETDRAIDSFSEALRLDPSKTYRYNYRGMLFYAQGRYSEAEADFKKVTSDLSTSFREATANLERIRLAKVIAANPNTAENYFKRASLAFPNPGQLRTLETELGTVVESKANEKDLSKAIELGMNTAQVYALRAFTYSEEFSPLVDYDKAIADSTKGLQLDPTWAELFNLRGNAYFRKGDFERAAADYASAVMLKPYLGYGSSRNNLYISDEDKPKTLALFETGAANKPRDAKFYFSRAMVDTEVDEYEKAIADYSEAIKLDPKMASAFFLRGVAWEHMSSEAVATLLNSKATSTDKALADYNEAIRLDDRIASAYLSRARLNEKNADQALADTNRFIELSPAYAAEAYYSRAEILMKKKGWKEALADYMTYLRFPAASTITYDSGRNYLIDRNMANAYFSSGQYDKAIALNTEILKSPPYGNVNYYYVQRGRAYAGKGELVKSVADFDAAIKSVPTIGSDYEDRAKIYRKLGQIERAAADEAMAKLLARKA